MFQLRNRSALAVNCCVIIHCLEVSCKEDQITSAYSLLLTSFKRQNDVTRSNAMTDVIIAVATDVS